MHLPAFPRISPQGLSAQTSTPLLPWRGGYVLLALSTYHTPLLRAVWWLLVLFAPLSAASAVRFSARLPCAVPGFRHLAWQTGQTKQARQASAQRMVVLSLASS